MTEKENVEMDYKAECIRLSEELEYLKAQMEKSQKDTDEYIKTVSEASQKEIAWLKSVINSILHIKEN